mmetsp:Transcript_20769/g.23097  ORF Transcript_20769/g.23097 Transcript_20769/m.23097 type:complete len:91 (-) Transcript_20769:1632-1904(-)
MCDIIIYSTTTGGTAAQKGEARAELLIKGAGATCKKVYLDIEGEKKQHVWDTSGKKGTYPLIFKGDDFVGTVDDLEDFNEAETIKAKLGV